MAPGYRSFAPQPLCSPIPVPYGNFGFCPPIALPRRLDGFIRSTGCLPSGPCPSGLEEVSVLLRRLRSFPIQSPMFWLSSAPLVFTRAMAPVSSIMHRFGFRILRYLDDCLVLGSSFQEISRERDFLLWLCDQLGILVNHSKSTLMPSQRLDYLSMTLQSSPLRAFPTQAHVQKCSRSSPNSGPLSSSRWLFGFLFWGSCPLSLRLSQAPGSVCGPSSEGGRLLPPGSSVVVRRRSSGGRGTSRPPSSGLNFVYERSDTCQVCGLRVLSFRSTTENF